VSVSARESALSMLIGLERPSSRAQRHEFPSDPKDRAFATDLVSTTEKYRLLLDNILSVYSNRALASLSPVLRNALRIGAAQLLILGTPPYAAINSTVDCVKKITERKYCNAVLRALSREQGHLEMPDLDSEPDLYLKHRFSVPQFIADIYRDKLGIEGALKALYLANRPPVITLRANLTKVSRATLVQEFKKKGYEVREGRFPESFYVTGGRNIMEMPGFQDGLFSVQDEGAMAIGHILAPCPGEEIWDVCSAPGGKATHAAELMGNRGSILSTDIDRDRLLMIKQSVERLGHNIITSKLHDATKPLKSAVFDRVLVDAPCTGLGVLRRNPDLRWNRRPEDIDNLSEIQRAILDKIPPKVKEGGFIVYSTCTLTRRENEETWDWFLSKYQEFQPALEAYSLPHDLTTQCDFKKGSLYILPDNENDGFFVAKARKVCRR
jgi:16S rRNA (cytosine967-C5)-methyltransferase